MKLFLISITILSLSMISCNNTSEKKTEPISPAETRSTMEYNQNQLDSIPEGTSTEQMFTGGDGEPFWSVEITSDTLRFGSPEKTITIPVPDPKVSDNSTVYSGKYEKGTIVVTLTEEACEGAMSGKNESHTVKVQIENSDEQNPQTYTGCGTYNKAL